MSRKRISKDGDCFFRAVAMNIIHITSTGEIDDQVVKHFRELGLLKQNENSLVTKLRELTVSEWSGKNKKDYQCFLVDNVNFEKEIEQFSQPGYFTGDLGDFMVNAMANVLNTSIQIFPSQGNIPIDTKPRQQLPGMPLLLLSYNAAGAGHYDYVYQENDLSEPEERTSKEKKEKQGKVFCSRGVNRKGRGPVANVSNNVISSYSSRSKFLTAQVSCAGSYTCCGCSNSMSI